MMETVRLFDFDFHSATDNSQVVNFLLNPDLTGGRLPFLITPNVDQIVKFNRAENKGLKERLRHAALILPDGQPIVWTSKLKKTATLKSRLTGSDLFPELWNGLKKSEKKVFFILPNDELGKQFKTEYPNCDYYAPPFFKLEQQEDYNEVLKTAVAAIQTFSPHHVMVGLGFPKQETLSLAIHDSLSDKGVFFHLLGASFEFYQGKKARAPKWMQSIGLEFLHRILSEPGRMIKRYLVDDLAFFPLLLRELRRP